MEKELKNRLEGLISEYINIFEKKHNMVLDFWVDDEVGTIACFGDYYIDFSTIRYDIEQKVDSKILIQWYETTLEAHAKGDHFINFNTYIKTKTS